AADHSRQRRCAFRGRGAAIQVARHRRGAGPERAAGHQGAIGQATAMAFGATAARSRIVVDGTIAGAALASVVISMVAAHDLRGVMGALLALVALAIAVIDARHFIIPNELSAAGFALALVNAGIANPDFALAAIAAALLRGAVLALVFLSVRVAY